MTNEHTGMLGGLNFAFLHRVYRTSALVVVVCGLALWQKLGPAAALGWLLGALLSLALLAGVEWSVRRFVRPDARSLRPLLAFSAFKLAGVGAALCFGFFAATRGWLALPWVLGGFSLPPAVMLLKFVGRKWQDVGGGGQQAGKNPRR